MPKALHVVTTDLRRGAELRAAELVAALRLRGSADDLVALRSVEAGDGAVPSLGTRPTRHPATLLRLRRAAARAEVVVGHGGDTLSAVPVALVGRRIPFVYETIGDPGYWRARPRARLQARMLLARATRVVVLYPRAADELARSGVAAGRITVIPPGIDADRFDVADDAQKGAARGRLGLVQDVPTAALVASLTEEKGPVRAVEALPAGWQLLVAGSGPLAGEVREAAARRGVAVRMLGSVDDVRDVYRSADVVVVPSSTEGVPAVAIEAALAGVPVVASDVGGLASVVEDGGTGRLVPAGDLQALGAAVLEAGRHPEWGAAARSAAMRRFSVTTWIDRWSELLSEVVG